MMNNRLKPIFPLIALLITFSPLHAGLENLAKNATISANAQYSPAYSPKYLADGKIPAPGCRNDTHQAWCLPQFQSKDAQLTFRWEKPTTVASVIYWGRTAFLDNENFASCQVYLDNAITPIITTNLKKGGQAQSVNLPEPATVKTLTLKFPSNYGGGNPGASEIGIYANILTTSQLEMVQLNPLNPKIFSEIATGQFGFTKLLLTQRHPINSSHVYTYHQEGLRPGGGLWVVDFSSGKPVRTKILDAAKGEILDVNIHYDGKTALLSYKPTMADKFQIYTIDLASKKLKQITKDPSNNFNACWLPDGGIGFLSDRKPAFAYCWKTSTPILWRCDSDGSNQIRLSANYLNDFTPSVLENGRIVYSRWEYVDRPAIPIQSLWTINPDGTRLEGLFGNRSLSPATFMDAREIPESNGKILCVLTAHNGACRGAIGIINPALGANSQAAINNLTPEINIGKVNKGNGNYIRGPYLNPYPLDKKHYLVSKAGTIQLRSYDGATIVNIINPDSKLGFYYPQPIRTRKPEKLFASSLPVTKKNTSDCSPQTQWATVMMQDVYNGLGNAVPRGTIKKLAIVQEVEKPLGIDPSYKAFGFQFPVVSCGATYAPKKIWGYATIEPDGSANFKVPAQQPIYFLPLDEQGRAVQRMRTFTHLMPGEIQSCVGCHADRSSLPPTMSATSRRPTAMLRPTEELEIPEWGRSGFSYPHVVQPVLDKHCTKCHDRKKPKANLELTGDKTDFFNVSYENLVRKGTQAELWHVGGFGGPFKRSRYTSWIPTYNGQEENILEIAPGRWGAKASLLAKVIATGHLNKKGKPRVNLTDTEKRRIYTWLDLNCPYYHTSDSNYKQLTGCRRQLPPKFIKTVNDMAKRRCISCHKNAGKNSHWVTSSPNAFFVRLDHPELNPFLQAPLAGDTQKCPEATFKDTNDPDYQLILQSFKQLQKDLSKKPRIDMTPVIDAPCNCPLPPKQTKSKQHAFKKER